MGTFSNGVSALAYEEAYCDRCVHHRGCEVMFLHFDHNHDESEKPDSFLHRLIPRTENTLGNLKCKMFHEKSQ